MSGSVQPCPIECEGAQAKLAELEQWRTEADLADAAYGRPPPKQIGDYQLVEGDDLKKVGLKPEDLEIEGTNFGAVVYKKPGPNGDQYVTSFRGTEEWVKGWGPGSDSIANYEQAFDKRTNGAPTPYYSRAQEISRKMAVKLSESGSPSPHFVGHSLGGGLASAAAAATGSSATTFNAAGLNKNTVTGGMSGKEVNAIYVKGDILTTLQKSLPLPKAYGTREVPLNPPFSFGRDILLRGLAGIGSAVRGGLLHMMGSVKGSLDRAVDEAKDEVKDKCGTGNPPRRRRRRRRR